MQLTRYTDYSLRVLIFLAIRENNKRVTITHISDHFDIPRNHLVKVVHELGRLGYINTARGKNGGICLGLPADQIYISDVVEKMENTLEIVNCEAPSPCPLISNCKLKIVLKDATQAFMAVLSEYTIADLQATSSEIKVLLRL